MKHTRIFLIVMSFLIFSCKKENVISEWNYSKRIEILNPLSSVQIFQTPSLTDKTRYLIEGFKTPIIAIVIGDNLTVTSMDGSFIFSTVRDIERKINSTNLANRSILTCQANQRKLCYSSTTCSIAYTLGWLVMEVIFAGNCSMGSNKL